ncbi:gamma-mobile-trio protein GmtX [Aeromonas sobria]|uniref:gamma-mobile-trio protein GmtX n=1 Tax=Aeromonas sobria TaxID=646 RepID=UPI00111B83D5|nr:gamma-mobile-trio protein GmtX [Aeromonas sobria]TNI88668.1 hypothetical protein CF119_01460 [Aeromonas sobria]
MEIIKYTAQKDVETLLEKLMEKTKKSDQRQLLCHINEVCLKLAAQGSVPSISSVVKILGNKGIQVSKQSIYNKRKGENPYPILIEAWAELVGSKELGLPQSLDLKPLAFTESDLMGITDPVSQHKMKIILGQYESLKNQNIALREIQKLPLISLDMVSVESSMPTLDTYEREVISAFLKNLHPSLSFDKEGTLVSTKPIQIGTYLSEPGLQEALQKALGDTPLLNNQ